MSNSPASLVEAASAVATLGVCQGDITLLDDASLVQGLRLVRELDGQAQTYKLWMSTEIARRSAYTLGFDGLARKNGSATPAIFIQSLTGSSIEEATRLARMGQSMADAELEGRTQTPVATAALSGAISVDAADAIRRGLGEPDIAATAEQLSDIADELIARASSMTPEDLLRAARRARNDLDLDSIERGEKQRAMTRYVRVWKRDGMSGGSWALPDEDGGLEIFTALKLLVANKTNGPRFADATRDSVSGADTSGTAGGASANGGAGANGSADAKGRAGAHGTASAKGGAGEATGTADGTAGRTTDPLALDEREPEQIMADGFAQLFHNGIGADPSIVPGAGRAAVRVIVRESVLTDRVAD
jgi:hypothetical protein